MDRIKLEGIGMTSRRTRERMVERLQEQGIEHPELLRVMLTTPRHIFVDEALSHRAYEDTALPIGYHQTISQPYIVAKMTELLMQHGPMRKVMELGTGSGYQTAILCQLVDQVVTLERLRPLLEKARKRMRLLGLRNADYHHADGFQGLPKAAPFDGILVAAAPPQVPAALLDQLSPDGGVLVMPVGAGQQQLQVFERQGDEIEQRSIEPVRFVPLLPGCE